MRLPAIAALAAVLALPALTEVMAGKSVSTPATRAYGCSVKYAGE